MEALTKVLGPTLGALLDDAEAVFTIAGLQPNYSRVVDDLEADPSLTERVRSSLRYDDLRVTLDGFSFEIDSSSGLERFTGQSRLPWILKYNRMNGPADVTDWYKAQNPPSSDINSLTFLSYLQKGAPDSAFSSLVKSSADPTAQKRELLVAVPWAEEFESSTLPMTVLPEYVNESFQNWHRERAEFAARYYSLREVRARFRSDWWRRAREEHPLLSILPRTEHFLLSEYLIYSVPGNVSTGTQQELVLVAHAKEWAALIREGATPAQWLAAFMKWSGDEGLVDPVSQDDMENWLWWGAWEHSPSRALVYRALKEVQPEYFSSQSERKLKFWLEREESNAGGEPEEEEIQDVLVLYSHPEVKAYFSKCSPEFRNSLLKRLQRFRKMELCEPLLRAAPYGG